MWKTLLARSFSTIVLLSLFCLAIFEKGKIGFSVFLLLVFLLCILTFKEIGDILKKSEIPFYPFFTGLGCIT